MFINKDTMFTRVNIMFVESKHICSAMIHIGIIHIKQNTKGVRLLRELVVGANHSINLNSTTFEERQRQLEEQELKEKEERERAKKSPYKEFVQVNKEAYRLEDKLMSESPIAYRIFRFLVNNMDGYNAVVCSQTVLQEKFEVGRTTVYKAIKLLKEKNFLTVYKSGTNNVYAINKNIVWNSWGTNYKYAKFGANIIISETEQDEDIKSKIKAVKHKEITVEKE